VSAARRFYEYAANAGGARAATALAKTFDPAFVLQLGTIGMTADPARAEAWYRRAAQLGDLDARPLLQKLEMDAAR